jgi:hypothetical protein
LPSQPSGRVPDVLDSQPGVPFRRGAENSWSAVRRTVVDGDDLEQRVVDLCEGGQRSRKFLLLVARRKNQRDARAGGTRIMLVQVRQTQRAAGDSQALQDPEEKDEREKEQPGQMHELVFNTADTVS